MTAIRKINDLKTQAVAITGVLLSVSKDIGMKQLAEDMQQSLVKFILQYFSFLTIDELIQAFDFAFAGKLEIDTNVYGSQLNKKYVGLVLSEYCKLRKNAKQYHRAPVERQLKSGNDEKNRQAVEDWKERMRSIQTDQDWNRVNGIDYIMINKHLHEFSEEEKETATEAVKKQTEREVRADYARRKIKGIDIKNILSNIHDGEGDRLKNNAMRWLAVEWLKGNEA